MNIRKPLSMLKKIYINKLGFHTDRKIIVIESDDWGSIRMPSKEVYDKLVNTGDPANADAFLRNDSLESADDLEQLYDTLIQYKDIHGRHPCITTNFAVANPKFENICPSEMIYDYELFIETYEKYGYDKKKMMNILNQGIADHLIKPQLHTREHMNVSRWMKALHNGKSDACLAFENRMIGVGNSFTPENHFGYMDSLNYDTSKECKMVIGYIKQASSMFENIFGYKSKSFVASCFVWTPRIERCLNEMGVRIIQTQFKQYICPFRGTSLMIGPYHYTGQKNRYGQFYTLRNCEYEPSYDEQYEERAEMCIKQIEESFRNNKPAIINSHRMNYIGSINPENRRQCLKGLDNILKTVMNKYPQLEFMSTDELLVLMNNQKIEVKK